MTAANSITLRQAHDSDHATLRTALVALHDYENAISDTHLPGEETADAYLAWMLAHVRADKGAIILAERGAEFAGFAAGWVMQDDQPQHAADSNRYGLVSDMYVAPSLRGRGVAQLLLAALEDHLKAQRVTRIRIGALAGNASALAAYAKSGFEAYEVILEKRV